MKINTGAPRFVVHNFDSLNMAPFDPRDYSALKFGSDKVAKIFGYKMADLFYDKYMFILTTHRCVIIPSAFNVIEIAATILARHFMNRLNDILTRGYHHMVDWTIMHRSMSYIADYCFLSKEERQRLLENDKLYINRDFIEGKVLIFVDDVTITGTHEDKIINFLENINVKNPKIFCYYARYTGDIADIEAEINHAKINNIDDYIGLIKEPNHHLVVRAVRFLLDQSLKDLKVALDQLNDEFIDKLYFACLSKGYDKIIGYRKKFELIRARRDYLLKI